MRKTDFENWTLNELWLELGDYSPRQSHIKEEIAKRLKEKNIELYLKEETND